VYILRRKGEGVVSSLVNPVKKMEEKPRRTKRNMDAEKRRENQEEQKNEKRHFQPVEL